MSPADDSRPPAPAASAPWMVFLSLVVCLSVATAVRAGLGHPAGWLDRAAGRTDAVPTFAGGQAATGRGRPVRIESLVPVEGSAAARAKNPRVTWEGAPVRENGVAVAVPASGAVSAEVPEIATPPASLAGAASAVAPAAEQPSRVVGARPPGRAAAARRVTPTAPLRVYVGGDSSAEPLGYELQRFGARDGLIEAVVDFKISSGLANPGFFNWPARLEQAMAVRPAPEALVLLFGGNDGLMLRTPQGTVPPGHPAWTAEYARRAGEMMDIAGRGGARVYWVGMAVVRDAGRNVSVAAINEAAATAAAERPWVRYVDVAPLFGEVDGGYNAYRPDAEGESTRVRQDDGIHLNGTGSKWVATLVYELIQRDIPAGQ